MRASPSPRIERSARRQIGARDMQGRRRLPPSRQNESGELGKAFFHAIDRCFEPRTCSSATSPRSFSRAFRFAACDLSADAEEIALNLFDLSRERMVRGHDSRAPHPMPRSARRRHRTRRRADRASERAARRRAKSLPCHPSGCRSSPRPPLLRGILRPSMKRKTFVLHGKKISGGIAVGRARIRLDDLSVVPAYGLTNEAEVEAEIQRFAQAIEGAEREANEDLDWAGATSPRWRRRSSPRRSSMLARSFAPRMGRDAHSRRPGERRARRAPALRRAPRRFWANPRARSSAAGSKTSPMRSD